MLRRILRSFPHSPHVFSNKCSPIFRQRTIAAPLTPSLLMFLGVSVATIGTIIIHGDAVNRPSLSGQKPPTIPSDDPSPKSKKLPTVDEYFDWTSDSGIYEDKKAVNINRLDSIVLASNLPCEDALSKNSFKFSSTLNYSLFGVYDGHNGSILSGMLAEVLPLVVVTALVELYSKHVAISKPDHVDVESQFTFVTPDGGQQIEVRGEESGLIKGLYAGVPDPDLLDDDIDRSIKEGFLMLDSLVVDEAVKEVFNGGLSRKEGVKALSGAYAGSCALLGIFNNVNRTLKVAVTGDSRAVLGRRVAIKEDTYAYETHVLSADQNAHNPKEVERLEAAHPGENIFENGRVLGWGLSRAFGDAVCKWSREIQQRLHEEYLGDRPRSNCLTPPYFTAEPEITTTTIRKGDFVVLASDGLWDCLTNDEVVGLVGGWLETRGKEVKIRKGEGIGEGEMVMVPKDGKIGPSGQDPRTGFGKGKGYGWPEGSNGDTGNENDKSTIWERTDLPVTSLKPDDTPMYKWWQAKKQFVNIDENVAVHLVRNAFGGADRDLTAALLYLDPPRSRKYRDDISIQVIFFN